MININKLETQKLCKGFIININLPKAMSTFFSARAMVSAISGVAVSICTNKTKSITQKHKFLNDM